MRVFIGVLGHLARASLHGLAFGLVVLVTAFVVLLESRPDLEVWHTAELDAEFTADAAVESFEDYLALEERLFAQLDTRVYGEIGAEGRSQINRFHRGSLSDPARWPTDWNRSFELAVRPPLACVLLLHGLSDSPYSMRSLGQRLHAEGAWVLGLRVPGHGTAPSGLVRVHWRDMAAPWRSTTPSRRWRTRRCRGPRS